MSGWQLASDDCECADGGIARPGAPCPTVPAGRSREEDEGEDGVVAVGDRISISLLDNKRPVSRRGTVYSIAGRNNDIVYDEVSRYGPRPTTSTSTQTSCGNTLDFIRYLDGQHEPMHCSAPYQIVVRLLKSGRKRLRQLEDSSNNRSKTWHKNDATTKNDHHRQPEGLRSSLWGSKTKTKTRKRSEDATSQPLHDADEHPRQRRRWMGSSGTRNSKKNAGFAEYQDRDFLYPGVGRLPSLSTEGGKSNAENHNNNNDGEHRRQSLVVVRSRSQRRQISISRDISQSHEVFWQPKKTRPAHPNLKNLGDASIGEQGPTTALPSTVLAVVDAGASGAVGSNCLSTASSTCQAQGSSCDRESSPAEDNKNNNNNISRSKDCHLQSQQYWYPEQSTVPDFSNINNLNIAASTLQPLTEDPPPPNKLPNNSNTYTTAPVPAPAPQLPEFSPSSTPPASASCRPVLKTKKPLPRLPPEAAHIDLQCLPPRSSSKGACRSSSLFSAFSHHHHHHHYHRRRRSSCSKSRIGPPAFARSSTDTQSLISLFPRPVRSLNASRSAASIPSLGQMQSLQAVVASSIASNDTKLANNTKENRMSLSEKSPLAASPLQQDTCTTPDMAASISRPQTTDGIKRAHEQSKSTDLQDRFILTAPGERVSMESNIGRRLTPRPSLESKKLRCLGISDPAKTDATKPMNKMTRAERVFALRMRDICLARSNIKKDPAEQPPAPEAKGSTPEEVRRGWEQQTDNKDKNNKPTDASTTPNSRRNDAPGSPPDIPLPADPPVSSMRSPPNKGLLGPSRPKSQPSSVISLDATIAHKAEARMSTSSGESTHGSSSNKSWSSRSAHSGHDIHHHDHSTHAENQVSGLQPDGLKNETTNSRGARPLSPLPPPMSDEQHTGNRVDCGNCAACSHSRSNPSPSNNRKNTFFYRDNNSDPRIHHHSASQTPRREAFPQDTSRPQTPRQRTPPHYSHSNANSNRNSTSNHNTHATSSPQSFTRPRSQDPSHPHCEARIAFLERQNKMLQAALIAALDVGVTFDADVMRGVTSTAPVSIASPDSETNNKDSYRQSYASTATTGTTRTTASASANRRSIDGRQSYIRDKSVEPAANVVRSRSVRDSRTRKYVGDSYPMPANAGEKVLMSEGQESRK
ncbi:hypothetical protein AJ79_04889 [Helicocarpus griseus UAMH5409]|uniref:Uncharacterized protein n=1 Tax=Helicocarpus griseus UAMH5409 TaxID=1447875 RepID=A0A2B7XS20_9EURO|nr:hypothetical protein AJ79_04889 [Helicocarpus griseus UAMH5409]